MVGTETRHRPALLCVDDTMENYLQNNYKKTNTGEAANRYEFEFMYPEYMSMLFTVKLYKANISMIS